MNRRNPQLWYTLIAIVFLTLGLLVLYPQLLVIGDSISVLPPPGPIDQPPAPVTTGADNFRFVLSDSAYLTGILNSIWISLVSVLLAAALGVPAALLVERFRFPGRTLLLIGSVLPLALPPLVGVVAFKELVSEVGMLPQWLSQFTGFRPEQLSVTGVLAVLAVHAYSFSIYFFALTRAGLRNLDPTLEFAAGSLGANFATRLQRVILPALWPYLIAAALLTFMTSMSSYSAPAILGSGLKYMTVAIANDYLNFPERAAALAVLLSAINIGFLITLQLGFGGAWRALGGGSKGVTAPPLRTRIGPVRTEMAMGLAAVFFCAAMALPFVAIVLYALADHPAWTAAGTALPPVYTADHLAWLYQSADARQVIFVSALATAVAVAGNLVLAFIAAFLQVRGRKLLRFTVDFLCMLPLALPGTVIAFNLLRAFQAPSWLTLGVPLSGTLGILMIAYFVRQMPLAVRPLVASMARVDPIYELAAQSLGATPLTIFWRVLLPQLWPGVLAASLLCTVAGLGEYVASVMLWGPSTKPISIAIEQEMRNPVSRGHAAALALALVVLTALVLAAYAFLTRPRRSPLH